MKILYSAFECNPNMGSDAYVGWSWAKQMSQDNEVHVLTNLKNKKDIEDYISTHTDVKAVFHYVDIMKIFKIIGGRKGYFSSYVLWQLSAYQKAKELTENIDFDVTHHVAIADFRIVGLFWKLKVPFVYGPVGGGQETPEALEDYVKKYYTKEKIRSIINKLAISLPIYKKGIGKAAKVFVSNDETIEVLRKYTNRNLSYEQMCELGVERADLLSKADLVHKRNDTVHILVSGRLMYRKGVELLLDAVKQINTEQPFVVDIYGGGHQIEDVKEQIKERSLEKKVFMHGIAPYSEMPMIYQKSDIYVLPSLRETTGTAVIEAMANKLPVVALNQNGVKYLVEDDAGILADIGTKEQTIVNLADALKTLIENEELCYVLGNRGFEKLFERYTWESKAKEMTVIYQLVASNLG